MHADFSLGAALTPREREVLAYLARGRANKVIAIELGISMRTVEAHRARIFRKLGVRNVLELVCRLCPYRPALAEPAPACLAGGLTARSAAPVACPARTPDRGPAGASGCS
ncbi:response regulator transcription factor [Bordetella hinzii]|uniref:LuxR family transcriptional regulator n=1 Tax=Bordetella hinzii TaxID=103855 RepID=A0AAN1S0S1_9BORD|nr:helix-turn-helix transcriptional regulator [Bordetella hinzii]AZW19533.1 LuxR family transcriptional regulator [Bordetella hinzii]MBZ0074826.1 helix-turn-helix transcriptional regulator [Bordetella hinzii]MBZ0079514.1 helix-turn-helix transcriptional regulator [Bordetella hinzii]MBZ0084271.1 helix-turn-helix transcriptional regulator [Bordetella hinzii]MCJ9708200.1 helix-turn-helix transcriptional regulator [Bordetella hinzii]